MLFMDKNNSTQPIRSMPVLVERSSFHSYRENTGTLDIESISAALARVSEIIKCLGYPQPGVASQADEKRDEANKIVNSSEYQKQLFGLMMRETVLQSYLKSHADPVEDFTGSLSAWAAASGDVAYMQTFRHYGWESQATRGAEITKLVLVPVLLIVLTAFLGNLIATALQRTAFMHQKTFDLRLDGLRRGQDRAAEVYSSINDIYSTFANAEENQIKGLYTNRLRVQRQKLESINAAARLYDRDGTVGAAVKNAANLLDGYIICLDKKRNQEQEQQQQQSPHKSCSSQYDLLPAFDKVLDAHTIAISQLSESEP